MVNENLMKQAFLDIPGGVIILGAHGKMNYCNAQVLDLLEIKEIGPNMHLAELMEETDSRNDAFFDVIMDASYEKKGEVSEHVKYYTSDGRIKYFHVTSALIRGEGETDVIITLNDETPEKELEASNKQNVVVLTSLVLAICLWNLIYEIWEKMGRPFSDKGMTLGIELIGFVLMAVVVFKTAIKLRDFGYGVRNLSKILLKDGIIALVLVGLMLGAKAILLKTSPGIFKENVPFWNWSAYNIGVPLYLITSIVQEFISRGALQEILTRIYSGPRKDFNAIVVSSLFFTGIHIHKGIVFMLGAFVLSILLGYLYKSDKTIWGVSLIHFVFGISPRFLGLW